MERCTELACIFQDPDNVRQLEQRTRQASLFYDKSLGFGTFRRCFEDPDCTDDELITLACNFFTLNKVSSILAYERQVFHQSPLYTSTFTSIDGPFYSGFVLSQTPAATVIVMCINSLEVQLSKARDSRGPPRSLIFSGARVHYRALRANQLDVRLWHVSEFADNEDLTTGSLRSTFGGEFALKTGADLSLTPWQSLEFLGSSGYSLLLKIQMNRHGAPFSVEFDAASGALVGTSVSTQEASRLQMYATAMRILARDDAVPEVERLLEHPLHFVRWHAMRELLGMDTLRAYPHLLHMCQTDRQASVRRAALATLKRFFPRDTPKIDEQAQLEQGT